MNLSSPLLKSIAFVLTLMVSGFVSLSWASETNAENSPATKHAPITSLDQLLRRVESGIREGRSIDQDRLDTFLTNQKAQANLLKQAKQRLKTAEAEQARLKSLYDKNEAKLTEVSDRLTQRSGQLGEVFGVVKQQAQDLGGVIQDSLITSEAQDRLALIDFADQKRVPTTSDMKSLWFLMLQEMTATSEVKRYEASVAQPDGQYRQSSVMRVGPFVAVDEEGRFLKYDPDHQQLAVFARQPDFAAQRQAEDFYHQRSDRVLVDPSRGNLLELIGRTPTVKERIDQAGSIGLIIIALGALGLLVALWRLIAVLIAEIKTRGQLKQVNQPKRNNALGRVLIAVQGAKVDAHDTTSIEIRVDEALLKEVPRLEFGMNLLKLLAAVAPLLGLLGTVLGMIGTFQSITVFGTSDPKLMAGGISQALMTTVLGLCVAIPLLFSHSLVSARVKRLIQLLQQEAFSSMAETIEERIPSAGASSNDHALSSS